MTKKCLTKTMLLLTMGTLLISACGDDDPVTETGTITGTDTDNTDTSGETAGEVKTVSAPDFSNFSITQSTEATGETATAPTSRSQSVTITFSSDGTATSSNESLASISGQAVTASTADVNYILTGSTAEGSSATFNYKGTSDCTITLNGVNINSTAKVIGATKGGNVSLIIADGTTNTLTSTAKKTIEVGDDTDGSEVYAKLDIYGAGVLNVTSGAKGAISSTDAMTINPGVVLNVTTSADGKKGLKSDTSIDFKGGRTTVINSGAAEWDDTEGDYSAATCVKAPEITVSGGTVQCKATGNGGKGIRADNTMTVTDGLVEVITTGSNMVRYNDNDVVVTMSQLDQNTYSNCEDANPKGIHVGDKDATPATGNLTISGGTVKVKVANSEGIESKMYINISGGTVEVQAGDDAMNAGISSENNKGNAYAGKGKINVSGGTVYAYSTDNDAIDANGTISISGGVVVASGNTSPECGIDCDQNTFAITGGYVVGIGGDTSSPTESACTQSSLITTASSVSEGDILTLQAGGTTVLKAEMPRAYSNGTLLISAPQMQKGTSYAILKNGSTMASGTLSTSQYVNGSAGGMGGGGTMPGGGGFPGGGGKPF